MIKNFIFLGAPGVGKGTLAKNIAQAHNLVHLSTGDLFRQNIQAQTPIGLKVQAILKSGAYVPDEITNELVQQKLASIKNQGVILDGFPRTLNQAHFLKTIGFDLTAAVSLEASHDTIQKRLANRAKVENRQDDTPAVIAKRIAVYAEKTAPLIAFYQKEAKLITLDVSGSITENVALFEKEVLHD